MDRPRVFEEGAVTLVVSAYGCSVYVGSDELQMFSEVELALEGGTPSPKLRIRFQRSHDEQVALKLDEERRLAQSVPWAEVVR